MNCKFCEELASWKDIRKENQNKVNDIYKVSLVIESYKNRIHKGRITCKPVRFKYCPVCGIKMKGI